MTRPANHGPRNDLLENLPEAKRQSTRDRLAGVRNHVDGKAVHAWRASRAPIAIGAWRIPEPVQRARRTPGNQQGGKS